MYPIMMDLETRTELILTHTREANYCDWDEAYTRRCVTAILALPDGTDLTTLEPADEDREIGDGPTGELDGLTDAQIVAMIIDFHW